MLERRPEGNPVIIHRKSVPGGGCEGVRLSGRVELWSPTLSTGGRDGGGGGGASGEETLLVRIK